MFAAGIFKAKFETRFVSVDTPCHLLVEPVSTFDFSLVSSEEFLEGSMFLQRPVILAAVLAALMAVPSSLSAQTTTGAITGVVRDADGRVVPGATIRARHEGTNAEADTVSDAEGLYSLRGLAVGRYTVSAELTGFQTFQSPGVVVRVNDEVRLD